jgi:hypothetical protein
MTEKPAPERPADPSRVGDTQVEHRVATDETGEQIAGGSVGRVTRRNATDETGETIGGGSVGTEEWTPAPPKSNEA